MKVFVWLSFLAGFTGLALPNRASAFADGTLLFLENCSSVVERTTHGELAHVALLFHDGNAAYVYEAVPGKVRRVTIDDYWIELAQLNKRRGEADQIRALAVQPKAEYTTDDIEKMRSYLDQQLGRRYSVKNYVRGKPYDGIHCAELAATTLNQSGRYAFAECHKLNPQSLYATILPTHSEPQWVTIPPLETAEPWTQRFYRRWDGWFTWCRWSCRESWLFLW